MNFFDMHCDTIMALYEAKKKGEDVALLKNNLHIDLNKMKKGDYLGQTFAMFVPLVVQNPTDVCLEMIDLYYTELMKNADLIKPVFCYNDIFENKANNVMSGILSIEEGGVCKKDLSVLHNFYRLGVRMITLTWNYENEIGYPNTDKLNTNKPSPNITEGLKPFGKEFIKEMENLGMIIDVSHLSDKGFYDVFENTTKPFIASHSNARSVYNHPRNLTDDMICKLFERGGVMGINFCSYFVGDDTITTVKNLVKHISYIKNLVGVDVIALGTDFDGIMNEMEIENASMMKLLTTSLISEGFTDEEIEKICYKNYLRVIKEIL